jgi:hypothetical protein
MKLYKYFSPPNNVKHNTPASEDIFTTNIHLSSNHIGQYILQRHRSTRPQPFSVLVEIERYGSHH